MNDFASFDIIISAVSNRKNLIRSVGKKDKKRLWIDLAMPTNINAEIADEHNHIYTIDEITSLVSDANEIQLEAIPHVENIIEEELNTYEEWLKKDTFRSFLRAQKRSFKEAFLNSIHKVGQQSLPDSDLDRQIEIRANRKVRKYARVLNHSIVNGYTPLEGILCQPGSNECILSGYFDKLNNKLYGRY